MSAEYLIPFDPSEPADQESLAGLLADLGTRLLNGKLRSADLHVQIESAPPPDIRLADELSPLDVGFDGVTRISVSFAFPLSDGVAIPRPCDRTLRSSGLRRG